MDTAQALQDEGLGAGKSITQEELKQRKSSAVRVWMVSIALLTYCRTTTVVALCSLAA